MPLKLATGLSGANVKLYNNYNNYKLLLDDAAVLELCTFAVNVAAHVQAPHGRRAGRARCDLAVPPAPCALARMLGLLRQPGGNAACSCGA